MEMERNGTPGMPFSFVTFFLLVFFYFKITVAQNVERRRWQAFQGLVAFLARRPRSPGSPIFKAAGILPFLSLHHISFFPILFLCVVCCMVG